MEAFPHVPQYLNKMGLGNTTSTLIIVGIVFAILLVVFLGLLVLLLMVIRPIREKKETPPQLMNEVAMSYINKPLPRLPFAGTAQTDSGRRKQRSRLLPFLTEDDDIERGNGRLSPLLRAHDRNRRQSRRFSGLPLRTTPSSKPTVTAPASHYTGETLRPPTPATQNLRSDREEVTLGLDQGIPMTPTRGSRPVPARPRPNVDMIPEEQGMNRINLQ
ncbi:hypothetical protein RBB50_012688 [Rhinocladiella similis]